MRTKNIVIEKHLDNHKGRRKVMKTINEILKHDKFTLNQYEPGVGGWGFLFLPGEKLPATVVFSLGSSKTADGWEHVSMSLKRRYPTWDEMCILKKIFFNDDECVVQFHPGKSEFVNIRLNSLDLWRNESFEFKMPPKDFCIINEK